MNIERLKGEIYYYTGKKVSTEEAEEVLAFAEDNPEASLDEIITDYYNC